ncbi:MAG: adenylyl-sulfate kinase [Okeania sp. SIO1H6]|nr:adenylyl-sulfate kinase [Okeania sp. SIO1H4]NET17477.1 adenylyl-sulfate kinase [Okeania sp. SIO1H6]NET18428.1 adenylyl-sulfate kinase [Okeania sp. SIO1H5]NET96852.1 adenylyl-sulfate kinase [Okeania sp. SIO1H2]RQH18891.1 adenylyl-sulfate kinase [Okeania hirsuta]
MNQTAVTVWFTGLSCAGKTTLSLAVAEELRSLGYTVEVLDSTIVRQDIGKSLGFSKVDRDENIRRIGFLAHLLTRNGVIVLVSAISPYNQVRTEVRRRIGNFMEVYVNAPLEVCEARDKKGLYQLARAGGIKEFTGIDSPYEAPPHPEVECLTDLETVTESKEKIILKMKNLGYLEPSDRSHINGDFVRGLHIME